MMTPSFSIDEKIPSDVLDEIAVADQMHVLSYFEEDTYTDEDVKSLVDQCRSFDLIRSRNLYTNSISHSQLLPRLYSEITEFPGKSIYMNNFDQEKRQEFINKGFELIAAGKLALVLLAGGESTRLTPGLLKGDTDFGFPSGKTLFERLFQSIRKTQRDVEEYAHKSVKLPIYVMTSEFNQSSIRSIFERHNYYGLDESQFMLFSQGSLPCVDQEGHFVMREKHKIALSPDGSGGFYFALHRQHILDRWKDQGIEYVHVFGIDNAMEIPADPFFLGYCSHCQSDVCLKCVEKSCPEERLSVVVNYGNRPFLAINSEMDYRSICKRNLDGELIYRNGFVFDSMMTVSFLSERCGESSLPAYCHIVKKAIPYYDSILGRTIKPITPNAYKMQYYLSDILPLVRQLDIIVIPRTEYAPIRNPLGSHVACPERAVENMEAVHASYLQRDHVTLEGDRKSVEISPLVSIHGENLNRLKNMTLQLPCLILDGSETTLPYETLSEGVGKLCQPLHGYNVYLFL